MGSPIKTHAIITLLLCLVRISIVNSQFWWSKYALPGTRYQQKIVNDATPVGETSHNPAENLTFNVHSAIRYDGDQLWKLHTRKVNDHAVLTLRTIYGGEIWNRNQDGIDLFLKREFIETAVIYIKNTDLTYNVMIEDIQKWVEKTLEVRNNTGTSIDSNILKKDDHFPITWTQYHDLYDIDEFFYQLVENNSMLCSLWTIGRSFEGREMKVLRISDGSPNNRAIFLEAGLQAREWIGPAAITYVLKEIISKWQKHTEIVRSFDWFFLAVANPDGYEYSRKTERLWSKNRAENNNKNASVCRGVNLDRNFGFMWGGAGSSDNPCSRFYRGPSQFSEAETKAIRNAINSLRGKLDVYISFGGYGQIITYPWGDANLVPDNNKMLHSVAIQAIRNIRKIDGSEYRTGHAFRMGFPKSGNSADWIMGTRLPKFVYNLLLRDQGRHGFLLPPDLIEDTAKEALAMVLTVVNSIPDADIQGVPL